MTYNWMSSQLTVILTCVQTTLTCQWALSLEWFHQWDGPFFFRLEMGWTLNWGYAGRSPVGNRWLEMPSQVTCFSIKAVRHKHIPVGFKVDTWGVFTSRSNQSPLAMFKYHVSSENQKETITWESFHSMNRLNKYSVFSLRKSFSPKICICLRSYPLSNKDNASI